MDARRKRGKVLYDRKYDAEVRQLKPIGTRLSEDEMALVDKARAAKGLTRAAWVKALILRAIGRLKE